MGTGIWEQRYGDRDMEGGHGDIKTQLGDAGIGGHRAWGHTDMGVWGHTARGTWGQGDMGT